DQNIDPQGRTKYLLESNGPELVKKLFKPQSPPAPPPPTPLEQVEAMSKLLTAMSNVTRVGVPLTRDDYSSVLKTIGLPPLPPGPAAHVGDTPGGPPAPHIVQHAEAGATSPWMLGSHGCFDTASASALSFKSGFLAIHCWSWITSSG